MKLNKRTLFHHKIFIVFADNIGLGSVIGSRRNFGVESKIKLNLLEGHLLRKKYLGRHSTSVPIFLKLDFFKMTDICYDSMVSEKSMLPNKDFLYITGWRINREQFLQKNAC